MEGGRCVEPSRYELPVYAAAHCAVDLACACVLCARSGGWGEAAALYLLYNFCAFALQMPLGILVDRLGVGRCFAAVGCGMVLLTGMLLQTPGVVVLFAGLGNALFHIGAGGAVLERGSGFSALGLFVAPGALGIWLGGRYGASAPVYWTALLALALCFAGTIRLCARVRRKPAQFVLVHPNARVCLCLFAVVVLRSYAGLTQKFPWESTPLRAVLLIAAVVCGKAAGGLLADRLGALRVSLCSLACAAALYACAAWPPAAILAAFLFNMTMPVTLGALADHLPGHRAFAFGALTFALFLGYLPVWFGVSLVLPLPAVALLSLALLGFGLWEGRGARGSCAAVVAGADACD